MPTPRPSPATLEEALDRYFSLFEPTLALVAELVRQKSHPQEVLLLLCGRIDALASDLVREGEANRQAFLHLLTNYSGHRDLMQRVSTGDVYYELGYHRWLIEGLIPRPGKIYRFSRLNDPIIQLLERSGISLTQHAAHAFLTRIMKALARKFRCTGGQRHKKLTFAKVPVVVAAIEAEFQKSKDAELRQYLAEAVKPVLEWKTAAAILYENFRNEAIHGVQVPLNEKTFFTAMRPYWEPLYSEYYPPFLMLRFPAQFLMEVLQNCTTTLRHKWLQTGKLPPGVHTQAFGFDITRRIDLLDTSLLGPGNYLRFQLK